MVEWTKRATAAVANLSCDYKRRQVEWRVGVHDKPKWRAESEWESIQWNEFSKCFRHGRTMHKAKQTKLAEKSDVAIRRYNADWLKGICSFFRFYFFCFSFGVRRTFTHLLRWMGKHAWVLWGTLIDLSAIFWNHQTQPALSLIHWLLHRFTTHKTLSCWPSVWISLSASVFVHQFHWQQQQQQAILTTTKEDNILLTTNQIR